MKPFNKPWLAVGATAALGLATMGAGVIHAASSTTTSTTDPMSSLVQALATKFNLNASDVQSVFDQQKAAMDAQRAADFKTRLDAAVKAGTLTQAKEDLIVAKEAEEKTFMDSLKSMSQTDRDAAMKTHMADLKAWATANSIPQEYMPMGGPGGPGGHGGPGGPGGGMPPSDTSSSSSTSASN